MESTQDYIAALHIGVLKHFKNPQKYRRVFNKLQRHGYAETSLYRVVAQHCEENDVHPDNMLKEFCSAIEAAEKNALALHNTSKYYFLEGSVSEIKMTKEDRELFMCPDCHHITNKQRKHANYGTCDPCGKARAKAYYDDQKKNKPTKMNAEQAALHQANQNFQRKQLAKKQLGLDGNNSVTDKELEQVRAIQHHQEAPVQPPEPVQEVEITQPAIPDLTPYMEDTEDYMEEPKVIPKEDPYINLSTSQSIGHDMEMTIKLPFTKITHLLDLIGDYIIEEKPVDAKAGECAKCKELEELEAATRPD
ncbi:hypothetical protein [Vibrio panuliri]|uniref:Uncharacterized protein n=1 Tax=Vibrio panuliri TaxID=1381081 RepID=A0ABX3FFN3_9VIBR|nr:hypothetical protein [Vibrio panuliri]KAB1460874.1 hypothetical protein F7O85_00420 [Vibrio panuliri]OLQ91679.1 hypothetical protein BIY20_09760 [Vibrio panuliri]